MPTPALYVVICVACLLLGLVCGWLMGRRQGRAELQAYKDGQRVEHERQLALEQRRGGSCWVRGQLPPQAQD